MRDALAQTRKVGGLVRFLCRISAGSSLSRRSASGQCLLVACDSVQRQNRDGCLERARLSREKNATTAGDEETIMLGFHSAACRNHDQKLERQMTTGSRRAPAKMLRHGFGSHDVFM